MNSNNETQQAAPKPSSNSRLTHALDRVATYRKDPTTLLPYARSMIALADEIERLTRCLATANANHERREILRASQPRQEVVPMARRAWRCFHCDEVLTTEADARNHFGSWQNSDPACRIKAAGEFALLQALRNAEDQLARYRNEDSDVLRAMWSMQSGHAQALRREEEKGYERGLTDAKECGEVACKAESESEK